MPAVHLFVSTGRFRSFDEMRAHIDPVYDEDDEESDSISSPLLTETGLTGYEPMCIEAVPSKSGQPVPLAGLLDCSSYADYWLTHLDGHVLIRLGRRLRG